MLTTKALEKQHAQCPCVDLCSMPYFCDYSDSSCKADEIQTYRPNHVFPHKPQR